MVTIACTLLALIAFAANSVLCRLALGQESIDPASFSTIRLCAGAVTLVLIQAWRAGVWSRPAGNWLSAGMLFLYAIPFSFAYVQLEAGSGALILFGAVQLTMIALALIRGERPNFWQWTGFGLAIGGLVYFLSPGLSAPPPVGAALMALSGCAWGVYSLLGQGHSNPLQRTAGNFIRALPFTLLVSLLMLPSLEIKFHGFILAIASGALASGIGYVLWYQALQQLTATRAAVVQLSVPVIAAAGGVLFLSETMTLRLIVTSVVVLGGVGLALAGRKQPVPPPGQNTCVAKQE